MDLLAYQGKQLFRKHGVPTPEGRPAASAAEAGAIASGSKGSAAARAEALEVKGVREGRNPTQVAEIAEELLVGASRRNSGDERSPSGRPNQGTRV